MSPPNNGDMHELPQSARDAILVIADLFRSGFSGRIVLDVNQGGVGNVELVQSFGAQKIKAMRQNGERPITR